MKRTPVRGVKQYLQPIAYNVWEPSPFGFCPKGIKIKNKIKRLALVS